MTRVGGAPAAWRSGLVVDFDEARGLGEVSDDDGGVLPFHCTSISDGTRTIAPGTRVRFRVGFRVVRNEAVDIAPLPVADA